MSRVTRTICMIYVRQHIFSLVGLDLYYADAAQLLTTAGEELDDPDHNQSGLCKKIEREMNEKTSATNCVARVEWGPPYSGSTQKKSLPVFYQWRGSTVRVRLAEL